MLAERWTASSIYFYSSAKLNFSPGYILQLSTNLSIGNELK